MSCFYWSAVDEEGDNNMFDESVFVKPVNFLMWAQPLLGEFWYYTLVWSHLNILPVSELHNDTTEIVNLVLVESWKLLEAMSATKDI